MATRRIGQVDRVVATDGELVMRVRNGDQAALAAIYDRYVARLVDLARAIVGPSGAEDVVHDAFVGAAGRIDQLRDPDKLKPWLYRITRRYALAHLRGRRVEPMGLEVTVGDATVDGPLTEAERDELRRLVDDAAAGLEERDRVMLHLLYRHELSPEEAGEVLDMRAEQVHARSFRVRDRFARSLGAVVVARHGRGKCGELRDLLSGWDGAITPRWRKKISRHLDRCETCSSTKDRVAAPMALLSVAPLVPIAASMRNHTLDAMSNALGFGTFDGGDPDLDGDSSSEQSQQGPHHPSQSQASHPASQGTASTSSTTASTTASASSAAPAASTSSTAAGISSSSSSAAAGSAQAGASSASSLSSSASSLTPTGPTTGWPSGTLAASGGSGGASSSAAAATAKATSGAAVPPTPEIVSSAPPPPELSEPGIASALIDTVKAAVGVGVGGAIAVTSTTAPPVEEALAEDPPGLVIEIDGNTIELSPAEPVEVTVPIAVTETTSAPAPTAAPTTVASTTTTVPETTTTTTEATTTTTVPETTTTTETTVPESTTTTTTVPASTTTTVPATTTTVDPLGGPTGADDGGTGGSEDDGETGGSEDDGSTGGADDGSTGGSEDDESTGGADDGTGTTQP